MDLVEFVDRALRIPFKPHGRGWEAIDCWGLCVLAYREVLGVELPSYAESYVPEDVGGTAHLGKLVESGRAASWERVEDPRAMDVALFLMRGLPVHVGLLIDRRRILHAEARRGVFVEELSSRMLARKLEGVYRLHGQ